MSHGCVGKSHPQVKLTSHLGGLRSVRVNTILLCQMTRFVMYKGLKQKERGQQALVI